VRSLIGAPPPLLPRCTRIRAAGARSAAWTHWCDGFLPGSSWILLAARPFPGASQPFRYTRPLSRASSDRDVHDLGYHLCPRTALAGPEPDPALDAVLVQPAAPWLCDSAKRAATCAPSLQDSLSSNHDECWVRFPRRPPRRDQRLHDIRHPALPFTTRASLVRADGFHGARRHLRSRDGRVHPAKPRSRAFGRFLWSRGLAWALYGSTPRIWYTNRSALSSGPARPALISTMEQSCPVPPWDYDAPLESRRQVDTSAAAIAASVSCNSVTPITPALSSDASAATNVGGTEGILNHGVYHIHKGSG